MADLTEAQLKNGVERVKDFTDYFSFPAFRELCKSDDFSAHGLPAVNAAYREACFAPSPKHKHKWSHPAVFHAGVATGWFELHSFPTDQIFQVFERNYSELCRRVLSGEDITVPVPKALPETVSVVLTPEQNQERMASLRESLGV